MGFTEENELTGEVTRRLRLAQSAIAYAKGKLPFGAANIEKQAEWARNWGRYLANQVGVHALLMADTVRGKHLTSVGVRSADEYGELPQSDEGQAKNHAALMAITARQLGAGVCHDFAAVVFFFLEREAGPEDQMYRVTVTMEEGKHAVVIIGDPGINAVEKLIDRKTSIVADAWPTTPFPVRTTEWIYRNKPAEIRFSSLGVRGTANVPYLKLVRSVFKDPYSYTEANRTEQAYRRIDKIPGSQTSYYEHKWNVLKDRITAEEGYSQKTSYSTSTPAPWKDEDSMDEDLKKELASYPYKPYGRRNSR